MLLHTRVINTPLTTSNGAPMALRQIGNMTSKLILRLCFLGPLLFQLPPLENSL